MKNNTTNIKKFSISILAILTTILIALITFQTTHAETAETDPKMELKIRLIIAVSVIVISIPLLIILKKFSKTNVSKATIKDCIKLKKDIARQKARVAKKQKADSVFNAYLFTLLVKLYSLNKNIAFAHYELDVPAIKNAYTYVVAITKDIEALNLNTSRITKELYEQSTDKMLSAANLCLDAFKVLENINL